MFEMQLDGSVVRAVLVAFNRYKARTSIPNDTKDLRKLRIGITQFNEPSRKDQVEVRFDSEPPFEEDAPLIGRKFTRSYVVRLSDYTVIDEFQASSSVYL